MKFLLDTHIFLWYIQGDKQLSENLKIILRNPDNAVYLSVVSIWEASIKYHLGKLPMPRPPELELPVQREKHAIATLVLNELDLRHLNNLPSLHRDPFDRMLICQALENDLTIVTVDEMIRAYPVQTLAE